MRNRVTEWLAARFGNEATVAQNGRIQFAMTGRGIAAMEKWIAQQKPSLRDKAPVQKMAKSEGWQIVEQEIRDEILALWTQALSQITSSKQEDVEDAIWKCHIANALNRKVLERVNGKALDVAMIEQSISDFNAYTQDYLGLTGGNSNG